MFDLGAQLESDLSFIYEGDYSLALLRWIEHVNSALVVLYNRGDAADELEAKLIEKGVL